MKIVVIGGSGLIGKKLVTNLRQQSHEVVGPLNRRKSVRTRRSAAPLNLGVIAGDLSLPPLSKTRLPCPWHKQA